MCNKKKLLIVILTWAFFILLLAQQPTTFNRQQVVNSGATTDFKESHLKKEPIKIKSIGANFNKHFRFIKFDVIEGHDYKITLVPFTNDQHPDFPDRKVSNYYATINSLYVSRGGVPKTDRIGVISDRSQSIFEDLSFAAGNSFYFKAETSGKGFQLYSNFEVTLQIEDVTYGESTLLNEYICPITRVGAIDKYNVLRDLKKDIYKDYHQIRIPNILILNDGTILIFGHSPRHISRSTDNGRTFKMIKEVSARNVLGQSVCYDKVNNAIFSVDLKTAKVTRSVDNGMTFSDYGVIIDKNLKLQNELERLIEKEANEAEESIGKGGNPQRYYHTIYEGSGPGLGIQLTNGVLAIPVCSWVQKIKAQLADDDWVNGGGKVNEQGYMTVNGYPYRRDIDYSDPSLFSSTTKSINYILYSKDFGRTWLKSVDTSDDLPDVYVNELSIAEVEENQIMINARGGSEAYRAMTRFGRRVLIPTNSQKGVSKENFTIEGWQLEPVSDGKLWDPLCHAAFARVDYQSRVFWLFCNPFINGQKEYSPRSNLMLQVSADAKHWNKVSLVSPYGQRLDGYSSIYANNNRIGLAYEGLSSSDRGIYYVDLTEDLLERILAYVK